MAGSSLLALIDDIATILDDVSVMTKVAAKKTAGVLGDDLALNAEQVTGVKADRELPVVWAVAKGSLRNKVILVPAALLISAFIPWLITPLLMIGGAFLCFEGAEKLAHKFLHNQDEREKQHAEKLQALADDKVDLVQKEQQKIKGAIRTDFILSAEIIVISLGAVQSATFTVQVAALCVIAVVMTLGVYGIVAGIVKLDDAGLYLMNTAQDKASFRAKLGNAILVFAPWLMKALSVVGTAAMFLVGGGILVHGIPGSHDWVHHVQEVSGALGFSMPMLINLGAGLVAGAVILLVVSGIQKMRGVASH